MRRIGVQFSRGVSLLHYCSLIKRKDMPSIQSIVDLFLLRPLDETTFYKRSGEKTVWTSKQQRLGQLSRIKLLFIWLVFQQNQSPDKLMECASRTVLRRKRFESGNDLVLSSSLACDRTTTQPKLTKVSIPLTAGFIWIYNMFHHPAPI